MTTWIDIKNPYTSIFWQGMEADISDLDRWKISFRRNVYTEMCKFQARGADGILLVAKMSYQDVFEARGRGDMLVIDYAVAEHNRWTKPLKVIEEAEYLPKEKQIAALYERIIELQNHTPTIIKRKRNVVRPVFETVEDVQRIVNDKIKQTKTASL